MKSFAVVTLCLSSLISSSHAFAPITTTTSTINTNTNTNTNTNNAVKTKTMLQMIIPDVVDNIQSSLLLSDFSPSVPGPGEVTYSKASYYTVLGLYGLSFPGLWSQIKRSTKAKVKRKTFVSAGENLENGKSLRQQAGEIMAFMKANNYEVTEAGETIKFKGLVKRSVSQAFFLTFCTTLGMISLALVLGIQFQGLQVFGNDVNWYYLTLVSPYAGIYYWKAGDRYDEFEFKLLANDDETQNEITVQGNDEEIERMWRELEWLEKGMVKIPGLLEN